jgi:hypothetical protein
VSKREKVKSKKLKVITCAVPSIDREIVSGYYGGMKAKHLLSFLASLVVSAGLLWLLSRQISADEFLLTLKNIHRPALLFFICFSLTASILRAWRYKILLLPRRISWDRIIMVTFIRNLFVDLLPARLGSLSYVYFLNQRLKFSFESAASSFVLAFLFDFLTLSPFLIVSLLFVGFGTEVLSGPVLLLIALFFFLIIFMIFWKLIPLGEWFYRFFHRLLHKARWEKHKWADLILEKIRITILDLKIIQKRKIYGRMFFLSLAIRLAKYGTLFSLLFALLYQHGFILHISNFFKSILGVTGAELTSVLPVKGIGGFGTWESAWTLTMRLMNFSPRLAVLSGIGVHLITNLFEYFLGILSLLILYFPLKRRAGKGQRGLQ